MIRVLLQRERLPPPLLFTWQESPASRPHSECVGIAHQILLVVQRAPHGAQREGLALPADLDQEDHHGAHQDSSHDSQQDGKHHCCRGRGTSSA